MEAGRPDAVGGANPLLSDSRYVWDRLIDEVGPGSMLVLIESRMGEVLRGRLTAEDIWQETLINAWRGRREFEWRGAAGFRRWLLRIAENRIRDAVDHETALRRGGGRAGQPLSNLQGDESRCEEGVPPPLVESTTPSRVAAFREEAEAMKEALGTLPEDVREVVRLRLFEELPIEEVAERLGIGVSAAKHRFRKGSTTYQRRLAARLGAVPGGRNEVGTGRAENPL